MGENKINTDRINELKNIVHIQPIIPKKYISLIDFLVTNYSEIEEYIKERPAESLTEAYFWEWRFEEIDDKLYVYLYSQGISSASNDIIAIFEYNSEDSWRLLDIYGGLL